jgi:hypothetical protein
LHIWSPRIADGLAADHQFEAVFELVRNYPAPVVRRGDPPAKESSSKRVTLNGPWLLRGGRSHERVYDLPASFALAPNASYTLMGRWLENSGPVVELRFRTDDRGWPAIE